MTTLGGRLANLSDADLDFLVRAVTTSRTDYDRIKDIVRGKADLLQVKIGRAHV